MATTLYFKSAVPVLWDASTEPLFTVKDASRGVTPGATLFEGVEDPNRLLGLSTTIGAGAGTGLPTTTVAGLTAGIFVGSGGLPHAWISPPISADFTLSGTVSFAICGRESDMNANATWIIALYRVDAEGALTLVISSRLITELGTSLARNSWTGTPTSTAMKKGDRLMAIPLADDAAATTMGAAFTVTFQVDGANASTADSNFSLTETISFLTADPTGTAYYLRDTASDINPGAATEKALSTTQGSGTATAVHTTLTGPHTFPGDQWTVSAGGADVEWYTPTLDAFTLGGLVKVELGNPLGVRLDSGTAPSDSFIVELSSCDADGSNVTVWARGYTSSSSPRATQLVRYLSGPDLSVSQGQRIRLRMFSDDFRPTGNQVSGTNRTFGYDGTTSSAALLTFTQTITEAAGATAVAAVAPILQAVKRGGYF